MIEARVYGDHTTRRFRIFHRASAYELWVVAIKNYDQGYWLIERIIENAAAPPRPDGSRRDREVSELRDALLASGTRGRLELHEIEDFSRIASWEPHPHW